MSKDERTPYRYLRGEGISVWGLGGRFTVKAMDADTKGHFSLMEALATRASEPPMHVHHKEDEAWYVLEGHMTFVVGDEELAAPAGAFVFAPRGIAHSFTVDTDPTRVLVFASPAGFEHFAIEMGEPADSDTPPPGMTMPEPEVLAPVAHRYGIDVVGPPLRAR